ncbi:hypothetical protein ACIQMV_23065 [Streptomyces sp. NPDC091412]|uniref:hypothetical protein n=1 Tax=Streptomyces sp. NPDC091412 TaxID=3366002 RepID=UPI0038131F6E
MVCTRRVVAAVGRAVSVTGLTTLPTSAAGAPSVGGFQPPGLLDSLPGTRVPAEHRAEPPTVSERLSGVDRVRDLNQVGRLNQVTRLVPPVFGPVPASQR